jgi:putative phosphoribosyl transferase
MVVFRNRVEAGRRLAARLRHVRGDVVVVGLPRGGIPVAAEVAKALDAPLDVTVVRKLGVPFQPELGIGAVGEGGVRVINEEVVAPARVSVDELATVEAREPAEGDRQADEMSELLLSQSSTPALDS